VMVRNSAARHTQSVVEILGVDRVLREFPDKLLPVAARFVLDGSPDVRCADQQSILGLMIIIIIIIIIN